MQNRRRVCERVALFCLPPRPLSDPFVRPLQRTYRLSFFFVSKELPKLVGLGRFAGCGKCDHPAICFPWFVSFTSDQRRAHKLTLLDMRQRRSAAPPVLSPDQFEVSGTVVGGGQENVTHEAAAVSVAVSSSGIATHEEGELPTMGPLSHNGSPGSIEGSAPASVDMLALLPARRRVPLAESTAAPSRQQPERFVKLSPDTARRRVVCHDKTRPAGQDASDVGWSTNPIDTIPVPGFPAEAMAASESGSWVENQSGAHPAAHNRDDYFGEVSAPVAARATPQPSWRWSIVASPPPHNGGAQRRGGQMGNNITDEEDDDEAQPLTLRPSDRFRSAVWQYDVDQRDRQRQCSVVAGTPTKNEDNIIMHNRGTRPIPSYVTSPLPLRNLPRCGGGDATSILPIDASAKKEGATLLSKRGGDQEGRRRSGRQRWIPLGRAQAVTGPHAAGATTMEANAAASCLFDVSISAAATAASSFVRRHTGQPPQSSRPTKTVLTALSLPGSSARPLQSPPPSGGVGASYMHDRLPVELLRLIFEHLTLGDLAVACMTCRDWLLLCDPWCFLEHHGWVSLGPLTIAKRVAVRMHTQDDALGHELWRCLSHECEALTLELGHHSSSMSLRRPVALNPPPRWPPAPLLQSSVHHRPQEGGAAAADSSALVSSRSPPLSAATVVPPSDLQLIALQSLKLSRPSRADILHCQTDLLPFCPNLIHIHICKAAFPAPGLELVELIRSVGLTVQRLTLTRVSHVSPATLAQLFRAAPALQAVTLVLCGVAIRGGSATTTWTRGAAAGTSTRQPPTSSPPPSTWKVKVSATLTDRGRVISRVICHAPQPSGGWGGGSLAEQQGLRDDDDAVAENARPLRQPRPSPPTTPTDSSGPPPGCCLSCVLLDGNGMCALCCVAAAVTPTKRPGCTAVAGASTASSSDFGGSDLVHVTNSTPYRAVAPPTGTATPYDSRHYRSTTMGGAAASPYSPAPTTPTSSALQNAPSAGGYASPLLHPQGTPPPQRAHVQLASTPAQAAVALHLQRLGLPACAAAAFGRRAVTQPPIWPAAVGPSRRASQVPSRSVPSADLDEGSHGQPPPLSPGEEGRYVWAPHHFAHSGGSAPSCPPPGPAACGGPFCFAPPSSLARRTLPIPGGLPYLVTSAASSATS